VKSLDMKFIAALTLAVLGSAAIATGADARVEPGPALANHTLTSLDGSKTRLSSFRGEVVVVNFWASWCAPCRKELPIMNEWHNAWSGRGARVVAISIDKEMRKAKLFAEDMGLDLTVLHDDPSGLASMLDLPSLPCTYLLDQEGKVVAVIRSSSSGDLSRIRSKAEELITAGALSAAEGGTR
jgi:thiol-disulfide isomerase/thioredoxin